MWIREIRAEGYGAFRDRVVPAEGPVSVFYGPNEAGKSTLLHLIRAVLFGFPPRSQPSERFEPPGGGSHGGALVLETLRDGRVLVTRRSGGDAAGRGKSPSSGIVRVTTADGREGGEELLRQLLGGVTNEQFRHLFAFTLTELQELRTLTSGELGGFLHSAGLGVRASAVAETERRLVQELESRFRPRGKNQGIGRLLAEADRLDAEWRRSLASAGRYGELAEELDRLTEEIAAGEQELAERRSQLLFLRTAGQLRESWHRRNILREEWEAWKAEAAGRPPFPLDGLERQDGWLLELERLEADTERLSAEESRWLQRIREWTGVDAAAVEAKEQLEHLLGRLPIYKNGFAVEAEAIEEAERTVELLRTKLAELDLPGDAEIVSAPGVTLSARAEAEEWRARASELEERKNRLFAERDSLQRALAEAESRTAERAAELEPAKERVSRQAPAGGTEWLEALPAVLRELRKDYRQAEQIEQELRHLEERELERRMQLEQLRAASRAEVSGGQDGGVLRVLGWFALAVAAAWAGWFLWRQEWLPMAVGTVLWGAVGSVILLSQRTGGARAGRSAGGWEAGARSSRPYTGGEESPLAAKRQELLSARDACRSRIRARLAGIGMEPQTAAAAVSAGDAVAAVAAPGVQRLPDWEDPSLSDVLESWLEGLTEDMRQLSRLEERLREAENARAALREQDSRLRKALTRLEADTAMLQEEWSEWLRQWGIGLVLPPAYAPDVLDRLEQVRELERRRRRLEQQLLECREERARFEEACRALPGMTDIPQEELPRALNRKKEELELSLERLVRRKEAESALEPLRVELAEARLASGRIRSKLEGMWAAAGAAGPEEFRRFGAEAARIRRVEEELRALGELLAAGVGEELLPELDPLLGRHGEEALAEEIQLADRVIGDLTERLDAGKERKGRLAADCARMLEGGEHGEKRERQEELLARFKDEASQWSVYAMAAGLLRRARELYERERQPSVLRLASGHFARMTEGRYSGVVAPLGEQRLAAFLAGGEAVDSSMLSRGTAEQLYLAIRFALAEEFAREEPMPLIMDDIFVNFDRRRLEACVKELGLLAERHQILVFTCHPHVVEAMESCLPQVQVVNV